MIRKSQPIKCHQSENVQVSINSESMDNALSKARPGPAVGVDYGGYSENTEQKT